MENIKKTFNIKKNVNVILFSTQHSLQNLSVKVIKNRKFYFMYTVEHQLSK